MEAARIEDLNAPVLSVEGLAKTYTSFRKEGGLRGGLKALFRRESYEITAVKPLHCRIERGEFVGLLGPNGAGKTTTLKMLAGLISPSAGRAVAFGRYDPSQRAPDFLRRIGMVMGQRNQLNPDLPALDSFRLAQAIYAISEERWKKRLQTCRDLFGVGDLILTPVRKLSLGERMKMELILAILHEPELLFLDEPTIGLDFHAAQQVRGFLADANRQLGISVLLTSHYPKDIEALCKRVVLINHGHLVYDGPLVGMDQRLQGQKLLSLHFCDQAAAKAAQEVAQQLIASGLPLSLPVMSPWGADETDLRQLHLDTSPQASGLVLAKVLAALDPLTVLDVKIAERPLEEIFAEIYRQASPC